MATGTTGVYIDDQVLTVRTPNAFVSEMLDTRMYSLISRCLEGQTGKPLEVRFQVAEGQGSIEPVPVQSSPLTSGGEVVTLPRGERESPEPRGWDALSTRELGEWLVRHGHGWGVRFAEAYHRDDIIKALDLRGYGSPRTPSQDAQRIYWGAFVNEVRFYADEREEADKFVDLEERRASSDE